ncbi:MAG: type II toxin-antitoxin system RelE/ParE family toxin [Dehalococcoidaceae bacterium]|nr:type II toxin-antitoxin system RelE/ParE family toxin [Dehalococcoidaceae bacterium]
MWNIEYYEPEKGPPPVKEFIESLEVKSRAKVARTLDLLEQFGINLGAPFTKYLQKQLWELRIRQGSEQQRIIYFLHTGQTFVLLHGFTKKTSSIPRTAIRLALKRKIDYVSRRML